MTHKQLWMGSILGVFLLGSIGLILAFSDGIKKTSFSSQSFKGDVTATPTPSPTLTSTPTPTPIPAPTCTLSYTDTPEAIHWTINSSVTKAHYICTESTGNKVDTDLILENQLSGILPLPDGFPIKNKITCSMSVENSVGVSSSCTFEQTIINRNGVEINGEKKNWNFSVSQKGTQTKSKIYGGGSVALGNESGAPLSSQYTQIVLAIDPKDGEIMQWSSPATTTGELRDYTSYEKCSVSSPCTSNKVVFIGGEEKGESSILLENITTKDSVSYSISTLESAVQNISLDEVSQSEFFIDDSILFSSTSVLSNGKKIKNSQGLLDWEFSYDGGKTFVSSSSDGNISGGLFIPQKSGLVLIRAKKKNFLADIGDGKLSITGEEIISTNTKTVRVEAQPIHIERAHLLGNTQIARNTTETLQVAISSSNDIKNLQAVSVSLLSGHIDSSSWNPLLVPVFTVHEYQNKLPLKKYLEDLGGKNWGLLEIPVFIPEYNPNTEMKDGKYSFLVEVYTDNRVVSRAFIPVYIGTSGQNSCDINSDGFTNVIDIVLAMKVLNKEMRASQKEKKLIDKNENGSIDLQDILLLFPCILGNNTEQTKNQTADIVINNEQNVSSTPVPIVTPDPTPTSSCTNPDPLVCLLGGY